MGRSASDRGITLIELLVVMILIAIIGGIVWPPLAARLESVSVRTTATQLAAQFRKAQAEARIAQTPIMAVYSGHAFHFLKGTNEIGAFSLPVAVSPVFENGTDMFLLLPSGQIAGAERFQLLNQNDKRAVIELSFLNGITAQGTQ